MASAILMYFANRLSATFCATANLRLQAEWATFGMSAAHASLGVHLWICPQARHRKGTRTFGKVSRITISVVRPLGTGRFVCGHLTTMSLTVILQQKIWALTKMTAITFWRKSVAARKVPCRNSMEP